MHVYVPNMCTNYIYICMHIYIYAQIRVYICTYVYVYIYIPDTPQALERLEKLREAWKGSDYAARQLQRFGLPSLKQTWKLIAGRT